MGFRSRKPNKLFLSVEQGEGMGARVRRSIGRQGLKNFDPFLMLDEFKVARPSGFPDHPHRGFETVTYILPTSAGSVEHEDFCGHKGTIGPGDVQWMTAGRGIVHAEMPVDEKLVHGLQLWINLSSKDKLCEPAYQELTNEKIPKVTKDGVTAVVIAGEALGTVSEIYTRSPTHYIHFFMEPKSVLEQKVPEGWAAFVYTLEGKVKFEETGRLVEAHHTVTFSPEGDGVRVETGDEKASFVIVSGKPLGEPIVQHGPFVMNSQKEILAAMDDYSEGSNGFEKAASWESVIKNQLPNPKKG